MWGNIEDSYSDVIKLDTIKPEINHVSINSDNPSPHLAKGENKITLEFKTSESSTKLYIVIYHNIDSKMIYLNHFIFIGK